MNIFGKALLAFFIFGAQLSATESKSDAAKEMAAEISKSLDLYFIDCQELPRKLQDLSVQPANCKYWGPDAYIKTVPQDPWSHPWKYKRKDPKHFELRSLGADGKEGGEGENMDVILEGSAPELPKPKK